MFVRQLPRVVFVALSFVAVSASGVMAQDASLDSTPTIESAASAAVAHAAADAERATRPEIPVLEFTHRKRPSWFLPIHLLTATVQGLDAHSTFAALKNNGLETNPLVKHMTSNRAAFTAVKVGIAAAVIYATDKMAKRNRVRAVIAAAAVNAAYVAIVANNYKVVRTTQARLGR